MKLLRNELWNFNGFGTFTEGKQLFGSISGLGVSVFEVIALLFGGAK